jgi:hypothetical protein
VPGCGRARECNDLCAPPDIRPALGWANVDALTKGAKIGEGGSSEVFLWGSDHVLKLFRSEFAHAS